MQQRGCVSGCWLRLSLCELSLCVLLRKLKPAPPDSRVTARETSDERQLTGLSLTPQWSLPKIVNHSVTVPGFTYPAPGYRLYPTARGSMTLCAPYMSRVPKQSDSLSMLPTTRMLPLLSTVYGTYIHAVGKYIIIVLRDSCNICLWYTIDCGALQLAGCYSCRDVYEHTGRMTQW